MLRLLFGWLLCWFGFHRWKVTRILKPHLYFEHRMGCDMECCDCSAVVDWRENERAWGSPFGRETEDHPNPWCPCSLCAFRRKAA